MKIDLDILTLARNMYDYAADMDKGDYEETAEKDINAISRSLRNLKASAESGNNDAFTFLSACASAFCIDLDATEEKSRKITYRWTPNEDKSKPDNNYSAETDYIIAGPDYDFYDFLAERCPGCEEENGTYYILDIGGNRTGEAYQVIDEMEV